MMNYYPKYFIQKTRLALVVLAFFILLSCESEQEGTDVVQQTTAMPAEEPAPEYELTSEQFEKMDMQLGVIEEKQFPVQVHATGMVEIPMNSRSSVTSLMSGKIIDINLLPGQWVDQGQVIAHIQNIDLLTLQQQYLEICESVRYLRKEYERNKILSDENINSKKSFYKAESDYRQTLATKKGLEERLKLLGISPELVERSEFRTSFQLLSPLSGIVKEVHFSKGATILPTDVIVDLYSTHHMHLDLKVFEKDVASVRPGQQVVYTIPELSSNEFTAKVRFTEKQIDETKRTLSVHGDIVTKPTNLLAGMYVNAKIISKNEGMTSLPETAVIEEEGKHFVFALLEKGEIYRFGKHEVQLLDSSNGFFAINFLDELGKDAQFLTSGAYYLVAEE